MKKIYGTIFLGLLLSSNVCLAAVDVDVDRGPLVFRHFSVFPETLEQVKVILYSKIKGQEDNTAEGVVHYINAIQAVDSFLSFIRVTDETLFQCADKPRGDLRNSLERLAQNLEVQGSPQAQKTYLETVKTGLQQKMAFEE